MALSEYGEHIGLAFQIIDDVLDIEESSENLGKTAWQGCRSAKNHFPGGVWLGAFAPDGGRRTRGRAQCPADFR